MTYWERPNDLHSDLVPDSLDILRYRQGVGMKTAAIYVSKDKDISKITVSVPYISN